MNTSLIINCETGEEVLVEFTSLPQTDEQIAAQWASIRADRNKRLADCDWTQLPDAPVDATAWAAYRQELRDITAQPDPFNIIWPTAPGA